MAVLVNHLAIFPPHTYPYKYHRVPVLLSLLGFLTFLMVFRPLLQPSLLSFLILPIIFHSSILLALLHPHQSLLSLRPVSPLSLAFHLYHIKTQYIASMFLSLLLVLERLLPNNHRSNLDLHHFHSKQDCCARTSDDIQRLTEL